MVWPITGETNRKFTGSLILRCGARGVKPDRPYIHTQPKLGNVFGFRQRIEEPEEVFHARDLECIVYPIADTDKHETAPVFLVRHVSTYQRPDSGRIYVGHAGEVDDQGTGIVRAHFGLKVE